MSDAGNERQRHGVRDIGTDDPRDRQLRIEQDQRRDADRAGADRRDRHQHAEDGADQHRETGDPSLGQRADPPRIARDDPVAENQRQQP